MSYTRDLEAMKFEYSRVSIKVHLLLIMLFTGENCKCIPLGRKEVQKKFHVLRQKSEKRIGGIKKPTTLFSLTKINLMKSSHRF